MDIETAKLLFQVLQFIITGAIGVYVYLTAKNRVTNERIGKLEKDLDGKLDDHGERIAHLEAHAEQAVTHDDLGKVYEKINAVDVKVSAQGGKIDGIDANVRLMLNQVAAKGLQ